MVPSSLVDHVAWMFRLNPHPASILTGHSGNSAVPRSAAVVALYPPVTLVTTALALASASGSGGLSFGGRPVRHPRDDPGPGHRPAPGDARLRPARPRVRAGRHPATGRTGTCSAARWSRLREMARSCGPPFVYKFQISRTAVVPRPLSAPRQSGRKPDSFSLIISCRANDGVISFVIRPEAALIGRADLMSGISRRAVRRHVLANMAGETEVHVGTLMSRRRPFSLGEEGCGD